MAAFLRFLLFFLLHSFLHSSLFFSASASLAAITVPGIPTVPITAPTPTTTTSGLELLQQALSAANALTPTVLNLAGLGIVEHQRSTITDCQELHSITIKLLQSSIAVSTSAKPVNPTIKAYLSACLTNHRTCLEGLDTADGLFKATFITSLDSLYTIVGNALEVYAKLPNNVVSRRRLFNYVEYSTRKVLRRVNKRLLQSSSSSSYDSDAIIVVAKDGSGNYTTVSDAVSAAPKKSDSRVVIYVKGGVYEENVDIPINKPYIALLGDGMGQTIITGNRSVGGGWTTYRSATLSVVGEGFYATGLTIRNTAGAANHQAVALRVNSDLSTIYRCSLEGYQDTLYVHSLRQFYRENTISGTVDFIFGNAAANFQACKITARMPMSGQFNAITAQARSNPNENTGFSIQNCTITADEQLSASIGTVKSYLGRPWKIYSTTVVMKSYIGDLIDPSGWAPWSGDDGLSTLYYGEYQNNGPQSDTSKRVTWSGYHVMTMEDAMNFTVPNLILGDQWIGSTGVAFDNGI